MRRPKGSETSPPFPTPIPDGPSRNLLPRAAGQDQTVCNQERSREPRPEERNASILDTGRTHMSYAPTRRQILQGGSALLAAATLGLIRPNAAFAAHDKITVRVERDLGNLDPANRTGPLDVNILNAVMQGLIAFKPGSTEWELDAAADIKQVSDTEIDFTLASGPELHRRLWPAHGRGRQILLRALHHPGQVRQEGRLRQRLGGPRSRGSDRPAVGQDHPQGARPGALGHHAWPTARAASSRRRPSSSSATNSPARPSAAAPMC